MNVLHATIIILFTSTLEQHCDSQRAASVSALEHIERQASTNTGALVLKENEDHLGDLGNGGLCGGGGVGAGGGMWGSAAGGKSFLL